MEGWRYRADIVADKRLVSQTLALLAADQSPSTSLDRYPQDRSFSHMNHPCDGSLVYPQPNHSDLVDGCVGTQCT